MFKEVKKKLTLLYTVSLLLSLIIFIGLLYYLISQQISWSQEDELHHFYENERHEFIEHYYEKDEQELESDPHKKLFFYVYSEEGRFLFGEESLAGLSSKIQSDYLSTSDTDSNYIKGKLNGSHYILFKETMPVSKTGNVNVFIGKDITTEIHFIQNITWILIILTVIFSIIFSFLGYYFAGQAMKPILKAFETQRKFVSDASHELRTPLSVFYGSIDLLMREEKDNLSNFGQEVLSDAKTESEMMNKLINDLLFLARSDNQKIVLDKKEIDFSKFLHSLSDKISRTVGPPLEFYSKIEDGIHLIGDEVRLQQLVYILLDNAIRYTTQGHLTIALAKRADSVILTVEDTGVGIKTEDLPHIFDRFYRADKSRVRDGSGLGLSIAKTIVEAHNGKISVKSEPGVGTTFTITFKI